MTGTNCCKNQCTVKLLPPSPPSSTWSRKGTSHTTKRRKLPSPTTTHTWPHHDNLMIPSPTSSLNRTGTRPRRPKPPTQHSTPASASASPPPPPPTGRLLGPLSRHTIPSHPKVGRSSPVATLYFARSLATTQTLLATTHFFRPSSSHGCFLLVRGDSQKTKK